MSRESFPSRILSCKSENQYFTPSSMIGGLNKDYFGIERLESKLTYARILDSHHQRPTFHEEIAESYLSIHVHFVSIRLDIPIKLRLF